MGFLSTSKLTPIEYLLMNPGDFSHLLWLFEHQILHWNIDYFVKNVKFFGRAKGASFAST